MSAPQITEERVLQLVREELARRAPSPVRRFGIAEVEARVGLDRSSIYRGYTASPPRFPKPFYSGTRRTWSETDLVKWEQEQSARPPRAARGIAALKKGTTDAKEAEREGSRTKRAGDGAAARGRPDARGDTGTRPDRKARGLVRRSEGQAGQDAAAAQAVTDARSEGVGRDV